MRCRNSLGQKKAKKTTQSDTKKKEARFYFHYCNSREIVGRRRRRKSRQPSRKLVDFSPMHTTHDDDDERGASTPTRRPVEHTCLDQVQLGAAANGVDVVVGLEDANAGDRRTLLHIVVVFARV